VNSTSEDSAGRPHPLSVVAENIPAELKCLHQWVNWKYKRRDEKWTKPPFRFNGVDYASSTDPTTWGSFDEALACYQTGAVDGIGVVVTTESGITGIDLDHCFNRETRKGEQWAIDIIQRMRSYTEFSPSGEGFRIFVKGALPDGIPGKKKPNIEVYASGRYFTTTGHRLRNAPLTIETRQCEIDWFFENFLKEPENPKPQSNGNGAWSPTDDELLDKAFCARNGEKLKRLFEGDISEYPSHSEADLALCSLLAFYVADKAQLDRLFRRSGLYREKWDERHGAKTYGEATVEKAFAGKTERYEPRQEGQSQRESGPKANDGATKETPSAYPYGVEGGRIVRYRQTKEGVVVDPLCNFDARVKEEIVLDDGAEITRAYLIDGRLDTGRPLAAARIPVSQFASMAWVSSSWGVQAVVRAGMNTKDCLREAIQRLSPEAKMRHIFSHTGWRKIGNDWIYISGNITDGADFEVDLGPELTRYRVPSVAADPVGAMKRSLSLLNVAPLRITAPLFASCYRAPLVSAFPQDLSLWLEGVTGSMKSTLAALFLSHFGDFDRVHLPGAWASTANQLERRAFLLKDSVFVIDDYSPSALDHRELETKAARLLRSQGNLAGRGRLKSDLTERPAFYPRGIIISTGEQHPPGQSLLARTLVIELNRAGIDIGLLTQAQ